jgi:hypothetical protein
VKYASNNRPRANSFKKPEGFFTLSTLLPVLQNTSKEIFIGLCSIILRWLITFASKHNYLSKAKVAKSYF